MAWFKASMVGDQGIIVHTKRRCLSGSDRLPSCRRSTIGARQRCAHAPDGSFRSSARRRVSAPDGVLFDTARVVRGLCAALERGDDVETLRKACAWMVGQIDPAAAQTPSTALWGDIANDLIHVYAIFPLIRAGQLLATSEYVEAGRFVQSYRIQEGLVPFNRFAFSRLRDGGPVRARRLDL
jgi:hypothetical protein